MIMPPDFSRACSNTAHSRSTSGTISGRGHTFHRVNGIPRERWSPPGTAGLVMSTFAQHGNSSRDWGLARVEKEFRLLSEQLLSQFQAACARASPLLSHDELAKWANEALALSRYSPPLSLEATKEYFRVTPEVLGMAMLSQGSTQKISSPGSRARRHVSRPAIPVAGFPSASMNRPS